MKASPFEVSPPTVTVTWYTPGDTAGTVQTIVVAVQLDVVAGVVPNLTVPLVPRFEPEMTTASPGNAWFGVMEVIVGAPPPTVKTTAFEVLPPVETVTLTAPGLRPFGTVQTMVVAFQLEVVGAGGAEVDRAPTCRGSCR